MVIIPLSKAGPFIIKEMNDVHLGHHSTPTDRIIENIDREFNMDTLQGVHIFFIPGDLFDKAISMSDPNAEIIQQWMFRFLKACKVNGTKLRILHGTGSHDFNQSKLFLYINEISGVGCDVSYFNELTIEHIEDLNLHVLYVPDEWRGNNEQTKNEVKLLLREYSLTQVDISITHGCYDFQSPDTNNHDSYFYSSITKHMVINGHIHTYSERFNITNPGSFDCIRHGEEGAKGYMTFTIYPNNPELNTKVFCKNKYAARYITINLSTFQTKEEIHNRIESTIHKWKTVFPSVLDRPLLFLRVRYFRSQAWEIGDILQSFRERFKDQIKWSYLVEKDDVVNDKIELEDVIFEPIPINHNTITNIIHQQLKDILSNSELAEVLDIVNETKNRLK
jgi:hypothetical protein